MNSYNNMKKEQRREFQHVCWKGIDDRLRRWAVRGSIPGKNWFFLGKGQRCGEGKGFFGQKPRIWKHWGNGTEKSWNRFEKVRIRTPMGVSWGCVDVCFSAEDFEHWNWVVLKFASWPRNRQLSLVPAWWLIPLSKWVINGYNPSYKWDK